MPYVEAPTARMRQNFNSVAELGGRHSGIDRNATSI